MAAFWRAHAVTELNQKRAEFIKGKVCVVSTTHELVEEFFGLTHVARILGRCDAGRQDSRWLQTAAITIDDSDSLQRIRDPSTALRMTMRSTTSRQVWVKTERNSASSGDRAASGFGWFFLALLLSRRMGVITSRLRMLPSHLWTMRSRLGLVRHLIHRMGPAS